MKAAIRYRIAVLDPRQHLFRVRLEIDQAKGTLRLSLPVWIPGSYLVREFSQHLQKLQADIGGQAVPLTQLDKNSWELRLPDTAPSRVQLSYEVYAFDASVRTAYLDHARGFFNPTSLCLRVHGRESEPHALELEDNEHCAGWQAATGLAPSRTDRRGFGHYRAQDYDELADCPFELGRFWSGSFELRGVTHRLVVSGAGDFADCERLLRDTQRICEAAIGFWHPQGAPPPFGSYLFLLHATQDGYGGLEHRNSTALVCQRSDLPRRASPGEVTTPVGQKASDGYTTLLGLISHEYFHSWNVKRLRPDEFRHYDYDRENYTELLWFFEGFTSYYDDLLLLRAGLIDEAAYLQLLGKTINQVLQTPGRQLQSVAQASFDAWVKYYRVQENTPNATVSYYTKGALVALCLDLTLRAEGHGSLDDVMRAVYRRCDAGPMREADLLAVLKQQGGRSYADELAAWVHGTDELPLPTLLQRHGIQWQQEAAPLAQRLGLRVSESGDLKIKNVLRGSVAEAAGLAAGDEWLGVELPASEAGAEAQAWRVRKLDDIALYASGHAELTALVSRDGRLLKCSLRWPAPCHAIKLQRPAAPDEAGVEGRWLQE
jgi:predicted metalloprotease with PDZ domain